MERVTPAITYVIGPGAWYHFPGTDIEILVHNGPMVNMSVRKRLPVANKVPAKVKEATTTDEKA